MGGEIHKAVRLADLSLTAELIANGADVNEDDEAGGRRKPLHWAAANGNSALVELLIGEGATVDAPDAYETTPLFWAAQHGHLSVLKQLIAAGADLNAADSRGWTPLHAAARARNLDAVAFLLSSGADATLKNDDGMTPATLSKFFGGDSPLDDFLQSHRGKARR